MTDILLLGILGAAFHFLSYRAEATRWLWSRYPKALDKLMACAACSGFWVGGALGALYLFRGHEMLHLASSDWLIIPACALVTMVVTPPIAWLQLYTLTALGGGDGEAEKS